MMDLPDNGMQITPEFISACGHAMNFDEILALQGKNYRELNNRRTLRFERNGYGFFAKLHFGIGWAEIFKSLLQLRLPIVSARNEWQAIRHLENIDVATMTLAAWGERGVNPATRQSFVVTESLDDTISLEELSLAWREYPLTTSFRLKLLHELARIARAMHTSGMNHRDFYLCHFLMPRAQINGPDIRLHLIDLHRAQIRRKLPRRWQEKDLAGLYFSALDTQLTVRECLRFIRRYEGQTLHKADWSLWRSVEKKAIALYRKHHRKEPVLPGQIPTRLPLPIKSVDNNK